MAAEREGNKTMVGRVLARSDRAVLMRMQGGWLAEIPLAKAELVPFESQERSAVAGFYTVHTDHNTAKECGLVE